MTCIVAFNTVAHEGKNSSNQSLWKAIITRCFDQGWEKSTFGGVKGTLGKLCKYAFDSSGQVGIPTPATIETNKHVNLATYPLSTTYD